MKTTYYLHMKPRHTAEQSTVKVNKSEQINSSGSQAPKKGFGSAAGSAEPVAAGASSPKKGFGFGGKAKAAAAPAKKPTRFGANLPGRRKEPLEEKKKAFSLFGK